MKFDCIPALQFPNQKYVQGTVSNVNCYSKVATIRSVSGDIEGSYDYLIVNSGLRRVSLLFCVSYGAKVSFGGRRTDRINSKIN
jgi:hypothetical protein